MNIIDRQIQKFEKEFGNRVVTRTDVVNFIRESMEAQSKQTVSEKACDFVDTTTECHCLEATWKGGAHHAHCKKASRSYFELSDAEKRKILEKAAKGSNEAQRDLVAKADAKVSISKPLEDWEKEYREKYEGANVWSSKAIDSQITFIKQLLTDHTARLKEKIEGMKIDPNASWNKDLPKKTFTEHNNTLDDVLTILEEEG